MGVFKAHCPLAHSMVLLKLKKVACLHTPMLMQFRLTWEKQHISEPLQEPEFNVDCFESFAAQSTTVSVPAS